MTEQVIKQQTTRGRLSRRTLLAGAVGVAAAPAIARAQTAAPAPSAQTGTPASTITSPPRDWTRGHPANDLMPSELNKWQLGC
jgi:invasion protein IalB